MKTQIIQLVNPGNYPSYASFGILLLRVIVASFMLTHGYGKLTMLVGGGDIQFLDPIGIGVVSSLILAVFAEFLCSVLLILGLFTRLAAIPLFVTMLVAGLIVHAADPFAVKEFALLYGVVFASIAFIGGGSYSFDNLLYRKFQK